MARLRPRSSSASAATVGDGATRQETADGPALRRGVVEGHLRDLRRVPAARAPARTPPRGRRRPGCRGPDARPHRDGSAPHAPRAVGAARPGRAKAPPCGRPRPGPPRPAPPAPRAHRRGRAPHPARACARRRSRPRMAKPARARVRPGCAARHRSHAPAGGDGTSGSEAPAPIVSSSGCATTTATGSSTGSRRARRDSRSAIASLPLRRVFGRRRAAEQLRSPRGSRSRCRHRHSPSPRARPRRRCRGRSRRSPGCRCTRPGGRAPPKARAARAASRPAS